MPGWCEERPGAATSMTRITGKTAVAGPGCSGRRELDDPAGRTHEQRFGFGSDSRGTGRGPAGLESRVRLHHPDAGVHLRLPVHLQRSAPSRLGDQQARPETSSRTPRSTISGTPRASSTPATAMAAARTTTRCTRWPGWTSARNPSSCPTRTWATGTSPSSSWASTPTPTTTSGSAPPVRMPGISPSAGPAGRESCRPVSGQSGLRRHRGCSSWAASWSTVLPRRRRCGHCRSSSGSRRLACGTSARSCCRAAATSTRPSRPGKTRSATDPWFVILRM